MQVKNNHHTDFSIFYCSNFTEREGSYVFAVDNVLNL
jgi:hypothetical protein